MLEFYMVKMKYIRNLMNIDHKNIMSVSSQHKKNKRIFVGVIVMVNNYKYCIPLSTVEGKSKYRGMSNNITFRKITNEAGEVIGALNINNMIPVREEHLIPFDRYQWMMLLVIPFFFLYNGKKGKNLKWFYYLFYPLHIHRWAEREQEPYFEIL